mmetsp:Transcript_38632/g.58794  ORF Transcript_38632/g.58794 Transcript_38632/m.58794 type:complete len:223 (+) Transcript_38632:154-822(+)
MLRNVKNYKKRHPHSDSRVYPLNFANIEEITKGFSKGSADANADILEAWQQERDRETLKQDKLAKDQGISKLEAAADIDLMNFIFEKRRDTHENVFGEGNIFTKYLTSFQVLEVDYLMFLRFAEDPTSKETVAEVVVLATETGLEVLRYPIGEVNFPSDKAFLKEGRGYLVNFNGVGVSNIIYGTVFTQADHQLYSYRLAITNSTTHNFKLINQTTLAGEAT